MRPVIVRGGTSFRTEISTGTHSFIADEPVEAGGGDAGPTPYDFLSAALGGCTAMTIHVVAEREKIPVRGVELTITNDRMHAKDCAECTTRQGYIHRFNVVLRIDGDLTPEQRARVLEVARRCPVYKTLSSEIRIDEVLA